MLKLSERLQLLKAGYSKKEIEALAEAEAKELVKDPEDITSADVVEEKKEEGASTDKYMEVINNLVNEVKELKTNIYQNNINNTEIKGTESLEKEADEILASIINPLNNKEEK